MLGELYSWSVSLGERLWGHRNMTDRQERARRLLEEAVEVCQIENIQPIQIQRIVDHVYAKDVGTPGQEVAGIMCCLMAYAYATNTIIDLETERELKRLEKADINYLRSKHQIKIDKGIAI